MSGGVIFFIAVAAAFPLLILVALAVKLYEVQQVSRWPETTGKVLASRVAASKKKPGDAGYNFGDSEVSNEPFVEYEYLVEGRKQRCQRVTIAEFTGPEELEAILERYPVGKTVSVFYDPKNPSRALLERELPDGLVVGGIVVIGFFILAPVFAAAFYFGALDLLKLYVKNPAHLPFVAALGCFGLAVGVFAVLFQRMAWAASRWPTVQGQILAADVEAFTQLKTGDSVNSLRRKHYKSSVVYGYTVNSRRYVGDRIRLGVTISSTLPALARGAADKFPVGSEVNVHYNPRSPSESVLYPLSILHVLPWLICAAALAFAWAVASGRLG
ncbi:DUF3592 domain-containing protein [Planctomicrobium piriforme]|uniref:DUF3592 domain-containing protein n=1 Tax=Planctomicrobium piriforme TaxID=1576369 RepID=A0A1I3EZL7_9PLAN|nr:DUF3592 domain-containing protein [Planctomicrobium piriforme]SFI04377.1 Protein of unknown function [Planctomicrobium piriforme]